MIAAFFLLTSGIRLSCLQLCFNLAQCAVLLDHYQYAAAAAAAGDDAKGAVTCRC